MGEMYFESRDCEKLLYRRRDPRLSARGRLGTLEMD